MHHLKSAALVVSLTGLTFANPVQKRGTGFRVNSVAAPRTNKPTIAQQIVQALGKYGLRASPETIAAAQQGGGGTVTGTDEQGDDYWVCPVSIGGQDLMLDFDTGSSDLWVFSTMTPASDTQGKTLYNPDTGTVESGETWSITYGDQSTAGGVVYADTVVIGGVTATSQSVEVATQVSQQFVNDPNLDGLLGLGPSIQGNQCSPNECELWFDTVSSSLPEALFAVRIRHAQSDTWDFGYIDNTLYTGEIAYVETDTSDYNWWTFQPGSYSVSGQSYNNLGLAIADTGTTLLLVDSTTLQNYYGNIQSATQDPNQANMWVFNCNDNVPDLQIQIGSGTFTVPGSLINLGENSDGTCTGGLQSNNDNPVLIFGDVFLKNQYVIFDKTQSTPRLGFAQGA